MMINDSLRNDSSCKPANVKYKVHSMQAIPGLDERHTHAHDRASGNGLMLVNK